MMMVRWERKPRRAMSAFVWQPGRTRMARTRCCPAPAPKSSKYLIYCWLPGRRMRRRRRRLTHRIHHNPYMNCTCRSTIPPMWERKKKTKKNWWQDSFGASGNEWPGPGLGSGSGFQTLNLSSRFPKQTQQGQGCGIDRVIWRNSLTLTVQTVQVR